MLKLEASNEVRTQPQLLVVGIDRNDVVDG